MMFTDPYAIYVISAYAATALILVGLIWTTIAGNRKARQDLDALEQERQR